MLDEKALRRQPGFDEANSVPVVLGDGQAWFLPKPWIDLYPSSVNGTASVASSGTDFDDYLQEIREPQPTRQFAGVLFSLAINMLRRNYDLKDEDFRELLRYRPADESNRTMWDAIIRVAAGSTPEVPKPGPAISARP
jgi:hypothetical protein